MGMGYTHLWKKNIFLLKKWPHQYWNSYVYKWVHYEKKGSFATCLATHYIYTP
jgi:hypothetical protein